MDIVNSHLKFNSKHYDKCKFRLKLIPFEATSSVFSLEVVQSCQHCQLCALRENSTRTWPFLGRRRVEHTRFQSPRMPGSVITGGKLFAEITLVFTTSNTKMPILPTLYEICSKKCQHSCKYGKTRLYRFEKKTTKLLTS